MPEQLRFIRKPAESLPVFALNPPMLALIYATRRAHSVLHLSIPELLKSGAQIVANIHHSHGVKATVSIVKLSQRYPHWTPAFWLDALEHAGWNNELRITDRAVAPIGEFSPKRAKILIARGVLPLSYSAVRSWVNAQGGDVVASTYLDVACADPEYLGHRLSILLAFIESWPYFAASNQHDAWADRLCEYLVACQFKDQSPEPVTEIFDRDECLSIVLARPGFFGHHAITLMWALRLENRLSPAQLNRVFSWSIRAAKSTYADDEDNVKLNPVVGQNPTKAVLEIALRDLLLKGRSNIHLLTLADTIAQLWDIASPAQQQQLLALAYSTSPTA